jgi:DNA-binding response OmpR family regulator
MPAPAAVLIAEDDPDIRQILHTFLEEEGYTVVSAVDGEDALGLATTRHIGLIVLDLQMPLLNGEAFFRAYRERGGAPRLFCSQLRRRPLLKLRSWRVAPLATSPNRSTLMRCWQW